MWITWTEFAHWVFGGFMLGMGAGASVMYWLFWREEQKGKK